MFCISYSFPSLPLHRIHYHRYYRCPRYAVGGKEEEEELDGRRRVFFLVGIFTKMWKQVWCRLLHDAVQDCWLEKGVVELWVGGGGGGSGIRVGAGGVGVHSLGAPRLSRSLPHPDPLPVTKKAPYARQGGLNVTLCIPPSIPPLFPLRCRFAVGRSRVHL